ncbi:MAG: glycan-binding surface protein [Chitinophagaceae bacterium]
MKNINKLLLLFAMAFAMQIVFISCKKDTASNHGVRRINYVRITNPESSDSLLVGAQQGRSIAIIGENLQGAQQLWFNDQRASLTPAYMTSTSILVRVPQPIPHQITNKIKIFFADGDSLLYDFVVQISKPSIASMDCEFVNTGDVATVRGDFFYDPLTVSFAGGVNGEIVSVTDKILQVRVPAGALPGQIMITTNFGTTKSNFWFRDNRNIFISSDPFTGWSGASFVVSNPGPGDPQKINGNYIRVKQLIGGWQWTSVAEGPPDAIPSSKNIPDDAILKPADYNLKFELNTMKPFNANIIKFNIGLSRAFDDNNYQWKPPFDTKGQWQTVVIPYNEITKTYASPQAVNPNGYYTRLLFHGAGDLNCDMSFDNFRLVPKVLK